MSKKQTSYHFLQKEGQGPQIFLILFVK